MKFYKYHAAGNDFIITADPVVEPHDAPLFCDRHTGIGADGILLHRPGETADARMIVINPDGSLAEMCGNGLRCFCRYLVEHRGFSPGTLRVETGKGILSCLVEHEKERWSITIDLGHAAIVAQEAPFCWRVDVGNPHLVVAAVTEERDAIREALRIQQEYRGDINVEILTSLDPRRRFVSLIVNERGAGFTRACGTGGAAVIAALHRHGILRPDEEWTLRFPGGDIRYRYTTTGTVLMTGDARFVFRGETDVSSR